MCDAAAKYQGSSLNSHLVGGPELLNNFVGAFMRFREEKVALSGDIEAVFCPTRGSSCPPLSVAPITGV